MIGDDDDDDNDDYDDYDDDERGDSSGATTPTLWVCPSCNHAHVLKDGNMIILFNANVV